MARPQDLVKVKRAINLRVEWGRGKVPTGYGWNWLSGLVHMDCNDKDDDDE
jgi:hypothetical protein